MEDLNVPGSAGVMRVHSQRASAQYYREAREATANPTPFLVVCYRICGRAHFCTDNMSNMSDGDFVFATTFLVRPQIW